MDLPGVNGTLMFPNGPFGSMRKKTYEGLWLSILSAVSGYREIYFRMFCMDSSSFVK